LFEYVLGLIALLLTPGPTNTLLALGAAERGVKAGMRYAPSALAAYLIVVIPLATVAGEALTAFPTVALVIKALAAAWVFWLAVKLWRPDTGAARVVTAQEIFVTTLLNPKGLVIGLVLTPHGSLAEVLPYLGCLAATALAASMAWILFGALAIGRSGLVAPRTMRRAGAVILAGFSLFLTSSLIN
jgi:threonine/homoserine/homoserine lactone efflux protein